MITDYNKLVSDIFGVAEFYDLMNELRMLRGNLVTDCQVKISSTTGNTSTSYYPVVEIQSE